MEYNYTGTGNGWNPYIHPSCPGREASECNMTNDHKDPYIAILPLLYKGSLRPLSEPIISLRHPLTLLM